MMNKAGVASLVVAMLFAGFRVGEIELDTLVLLVEIGPTKFAVVFAVLLEHVEYFMCTASTNRKRPKQTFAYMTVFI